MKIEENAKYLLNIFEREYQNNKYKFVTLVLGTLVLFPNFYSSGEKWREGIEIIKNFISIYINNFIYIKIYIKCYIHPCTF